MNTEVKDYYVTFLYGTKYRYAMPVFLFVVSIYMAVRVFIDLSGLYLILFALCSLPILIISVRSKLAKHKLEISNENLKLGSRSICNDSLQKIVVYRPITIYFHLNDVGERKKIEAIQTKKEDAETIFTGIMIWAKQNNIKIEQFW